MVSKNFGPTKGLVNIILWKNVFDTRAQGSAELHIKGFKIYFPTVMV